MERDGDLLLNVSCSNQRHEGNKRKLPDRMPDGSRIATNTKYAKKIAKTHCPATKSGKVFIPKHKLPVLDEFGLTDSSIHRGYEKPIIMPKVGDDDGDDDDDDDNDKDKAEGKPASQAEEGTIRKKRKSYVPGLNPRKREKSEAVFTDMTLEELHDVHPYMIQNLEQNFEIKKLTKIQSLALPQLLKTRFDSNRHEFIINSGIGSGKILSYVIPIVNNLALMEPRINRTSGIYGLVLLPTRELAAKVSEIFSKLCRSFLWVVPGLLTGGERKKSEKARLRKGLNILITTPGRLIDHLEHSQSMDFSKMRYCVMAEAHRLLDPERAEVSKRIAIVLRKRLPYNCVRCIVTATLTKKLEKFFEIVMTKPDVIDAFKEFE